MSLVTRCPKCQSDFVVKLDQLQVHSGLVRCGSCAHIFDGYVTLQSDLPTLTQRSDSNVPLRTRSVIAPSIPPQPAAEQPVVPVPAVVRQRNGMVAQERVTDALDFSIQGESRLRAEGESVGRTQPEFLVDEVDTKTLKLLLWGLAIALAIALLTVQLAYVFRNDLATSMPAARPMLDAMCLKLKCEVSLRRYLERISVSVIAFERQAVKEPEGTPIEMSLKFSLRNRFNQAQPWPDLSLELTDASGTIVLRKPLRPNDYLPKALAQTSFAAGQEVTLDLPITVTGLAINGYTLKPFFP